MAAHPMQLAEDILAVQEQAEELIALKDLEFIDGLSDFVAAMTSVIDSAATTELTEELRVSLENADKLHSQVLNRAEQIFADKSKHSVEFSKIAKGLRAYMDTYPKRMSAFKKREG